MIESKNNNYTIYEKENNTWLGDDHGVIAWQCGCQSSWSAGSQGLQGHRDLRINNYK